MLSIYEQKWSFDLIRDGIDRELRNTGFEDVLIERGHELGRDIDPTLGRLVVRRSFEYSSQLADIDIDLDPMAVRLVTEHQVGVMVERTDGSLSYCGFIYSHAMHGDPQEPYGLELDHIQYAVAEASVDRLLQARSKGGLCFMTKSLKAIDIAGD